MPIRLDISVFFLLKLNLNGTGIIDKLNTVLLTRITKLRASLLNGIFLASIKASEFVSPYPV